MSEFQTRLPFILSPLATIHAKQRRAPQDCRTPPGSPRAMGPWLGPVGREGIISLCIWKGPGVGNAFQRLLHSVVVVLVAAVAATQQ